MRRLARWGRALLSSGAIAAISACGLEVATRLVAPQVLQHDVPGLWRPDPAIGWRRAPNARVVANTGERDVEVCTDGRGDRVPCAPRAPRECAARVLVIGDSFAEALAVPWEDTVWSRLEADTGACLAVGGAGAYALPQYVGTAEERLGSGAESYDLVILAFYSGNDFTDDPTRMPKAQEVQWMPLRLLPAEWTPGGLRDWFYPVNQWLESRSHAYVGLRAAIRNALALRPGYEAPLAIRPGWLNEQVVGGTREGIARIHAAARTRGARLVVFVIPEESQVTDPTGARLRRAPGLADADMDLPQKRFVPALAGEDGLIVVDLLAPLRAGPHQGLWGTRDRHFSPTGHARWFEIVREPVREALAGALSRGRASPGARSPARAAP